VEVQDERPEHRDEVRRVHRAAFGDHGEVVVRVLDGLRRRATAQDSLSLVALEDGRVVGHVLFTRSLLDAPRRLVEVSVLSPLAVVPDRQGAGTGPALVRSGLRRLDERRVPLVFLEGDPAYYGRLGFRPGGELGFRKPSLRIPDAAFQVVALQAHEPWMTGTLVYSEVFWEHDAVGLREDG
jgi:putative acetyltransferase